MVLIFIILFEVTFMFSGDNSHRQGSKPSILQHLTIRRPILMRRLRNDEDPPMAKSRIRP
jgi:hypothetical protein